MSTLKVLYNCRCCRQKLRSPARFRGTPASCPVCGVHFEVPIAGGIVHTSVRRNQPVSVPREELPKYPPSIPPVGSPVSPSVPDAVMTDGRFVLCIIAPIVAVAVVVNLLVFFLIAE